MERKILIEKFWNAWYHVSSDLRKHRILLESNGYTYLMFRWKIEQRRVCAQQYTIFLSIYYIYKKRWYVRLVLDNKFICLLVLYYIRCTQAMEFIYNLFVSFTQNKIHMMKRRSYQSYINK